MSDRPTDAGRTAIPAFALYGEADSHQADLLHIETLRSRSRHYRWEIAAHVHRALYQVVWIESGRCELMLDEQRASLDGPAAVMIPPGVVHGFRFVPDMPGLVLTLGGRFLFDDDGAPITAAIDVLFGAPGIERFDPDAEASRRIGSLFDELARQSQASDAADSPVCGWLARAVLWTIAHECARRAMASADRPGNRHHALLTRFQQLIETRYLSHWPVARYASTLGISVAHLNRLARAASGASALELIHRRLTREACRRLIYLAAPVASVADELGFEDPSYFCRFFKRRTGASPSAFRAGRGH